MTMTTYAATRAQRSYFYKLTGEYLPFGCGKGKASKLIAQALAGEWKAAPRKVQVSSYQVLTRETYGPRTWEVLVDYHPKAARFDNEAAAIAHAETIARDGERIEVLSGVRTILNDA